MKCVYGIVMLLSSIFLAQSAFAQSNVSNTSISETTQKAPKRLSMSTWYYAESMRDENSQVGGLQNILLPFFNYHQENENKITLWGKISQVNLKGESKRVNPAYAVLSYCFKPLKFSGGDHSLSLSLNYRTYTDKYIRNSPDHIDGKAYLSVSTSSQLTSRYSFSTLTYLSEYNNNADVDTALEREIINYLLSYYSLNDQFSLGLTFTTTLFDYQGTGADGFQETVVTPSFLYAVNKDFNAEFYVDIPAFVPYDGELIARNLDQKMTYGMVLIYNLF